MIRINLLRETTAPVAVEAFGRPQTGLILALMLILALLGMGWWSYLINKERSSLLSRRDELQSEKLRLATVRAQEQQYQRQKAELDSRIAIIEKLKANQKGPVQLLNAIISAVPDRPSLWLESVLQKQKRITVEGFSFDVTSIADFIQGLHAKKLFQKVDLQFWTEEKDAIKFQIVCTLE